MWLGGVSVDCFCDSDSRKWGTEIEGIIIISPEELKDQKLNSNLTIIVSPRRGYKEIDNMLMAQGIQACDIYNYWTECFPEVHLETQYFDERLIHFQSGEVFVDGGCYDFTTSRILLDKLRDLGMEVGCKVYAFEPDEANFRKCKKNVERWGVERAELIQAGLWSADTYLKFDARGTGSSHVLLQSAADSNQIRVIALDSCIQEKVTFIKMDVEGAEMEALKGGKHIIMKDKPKLAICIYHKKEDMWEIPYYIKSLVPEYKLYIRHYSNYDCETVLYAVCD